MEAAEKSLIENWHREDLTSTEREDMVYQIWTDEKEDNPGYTIKELTKDLGKSKTTIEKLIKAKEYRESVPTSGQVSTMVLIETRGLDDETQKKVIEKIEKGEIKKETYAVREVTKAIRKAPEPPLGEIVVWCICTILWCTSFLMFLGEI